MNNTWVVNDPKPKFDHVSHENTLKHYRILRNVVAFVGLAAKIMDRGRKVDIDSTTICIFCTM